MTEREEFMEWASTRLMSIEVDTAWEAYQAGRASGEREAVRKCEKMVAGQGKVGEHREMLAYTIRAAYPQHFPGDAG